MDVRKRGFELALLICVKKRDNQECSVLRLLNSVNSILPNNYDHAF
jgi:hypothetical protein